MAITSFENSTRIIVQIAIDDDTGRIQALLTAVALLIAIVTKTGLVLSSAALLVSDVAQAADFTIKVLVIGLKSIAYGLGVTL